MKKYAICLITILFLLPMMVAADNYTALWKQYNVAMDKDLPKTQISILKQIINKSKAEKNYGHLLKAQLLTIAAQTVIAPDSMNSMVARLEVETQKAEKTDKVLAAVYQTVLGKYFQQATGDSGQQEKARAYFKKAMANPELLAAHEAKEFEPSIVKGVDSKIFYDDLLHVIGLEIGDFKTLHDYYSSHNNRVAACYCALQLLDKDKCKEGTRVCKSRYVQQLDSLIEQYRDLRIAGEIAIERYLFMSTAEDTKVEDKVAYINYALDKWGEWKRMNILRNAYKQITNPGFEVSIDDVTIIPNQKKVIKLTRIRNISSITMNVWKTNLTGETKERIGVNKTFEIVKKNSTLVAEASQTRRYIGVPNYQLTNDSLELSNLPVGVYVLEILSDNKDVPTYRSFVFVSNLKAVYTALPKEQYRLAVLDATTGQPVPGAKIRLKKEKYNNKPAEVLQLTCNAYGEVMHSVKDRRPDYIYVYTDKDKACKEEDGGAWFNYHDGDQSSDEINLFTDRTLYRPGQTVHVAMIAYHQDNNNNMNAIADKKLTLTLHDVNYKEVSKKTVRTDAFGKASTEFTLPFNGLTGRYTIECDDENCDEVTFQVEEYKRPTFTVDFPKVNEKYAVGDTIVVKASAKSYAGVPVQGAKVKYTVKRHRSFWWRWYNEDDLDAVVKDGNGVTDDNGNFSVEIPLELKKGIDLRIPRYYSFVVNAEVTDQSGETRRGSMSLPVGTKPTAFILEMKKIFERKDKKLAKFTYKNMAGASIDAEVRYYIDGSNDSFTARTNQDVTLDFDKLKSGKHRIKAICEKDTTEYEFVLFSLKDNKAPYETPNWFYISGDSFTDDDKPVYVQLGGSYAPQHILYNVVSENNVLESGTIDLNNEVQTREFKYKPSYGDGITLTYAWVKDGNAYTYSKTIEKALPNKELTVSWKTFRNKLTPGQKEEWVLNVLNPDGKPATAQLLAVMYDKSLDQILKHNWNFDTEMYLSLPYMSWKYTGGIEMDNHFMSMAYRALGVTQLNFSSFDKDMLVYNANGYLILQDKLAGSVMIRGTTSVKKKSVTGSVSLKQTMSRAVAMEAESALDEVVYAGYSDKTTTPESQSSTSDQLRENLNETAFFYPALMADKEGNVSIKFTLPESLTTWRFMGLAHDKKMNHGMLIDEAVAKKTVMVQPNMPRFMRLGDKGTIVAKIFNTSENAVNGVARLTLSDPETERVVYTATQSYNLEANGTTTGSFDVDLTEGSPLYAGGATVLVCKIMVEGKGYADGEQHYLPILSNQELVTNTVAFTQHEPGIKTINLDKLFAQKNANNKLTVEYTNNPAWLMIQSLPYVGSVNEDNAVSLASAYYANSIARYIMQQVPSIKHTIEQWKRETGKETSLMSNLQKNEELKSLVLNETPWVAEADNEAEQKQALIRYFDETNMEHRLNTCLNKLGELQKSDGSWSWCPGMRGSIYMTTTVSEMLARLQSMCGLAPEAEQQLHNAFRFMNAAMKNEAKEMRKDEAKGIKNVRPSEVAVTYLYLSSLVDKSYSQDIAADRKYMIDRLASQTHYFTIYGKAVSSVIMAKNNYAGKAKEYLQSMKEYSVYKEEMGRYYDTRKAHYSWFDYKIPTQVAAIETIKAINPNDKQTVEEMQRWLLMSKRTQSWDTPINSVNAIYAFFNGNLETLKTSSKEQAVLAVDGKALDLPQATAGLGYVKTSLNGADMKAFTADKTAPGTSWGAVYAQFMQKSTDIAAASSGISVKREIVNGENLKVGDKVLVRITIEADRDYDFVQVVDKRAACMEPVNQVSGYRYGCYVNPRDNATHYYLDQLNKGKHVIETEYYIDRQGTFTTGTCTVQCAYSPEYSGRAGAMTLKVK